MKWSWKIARVAGIDVNMHATFLLLVGWVAFSAFISGRGLAAGVSEVLFVLALFTCVVMHEYGHALTARRFGIQTQDITLLPIGGLARLERMPDSPIQELWVALAGPAVNLVLAAVLLTGLLATDTLGPLTSLSMSSGSFLQRLLVVNGMLALFNLIPAFPMDGGRVLRALLALRMEYAKATQIAASIGQGMALLLGLAGFFFNPNLIFIAVFVWIGAGQEASMVRTKTTLSGIPVKQAMLTDFRTLSPTDPLRYPVELILSGSQHDFPVVADGSVVGILTREDLFHALAQYDERMLVSYVMRKRFPVIDAGQTLEDISPLLQMENLSILPVTQEGRLVGLITPDNIGEYIMVQRAIKNRRQASINA